MCIFISPHRDRNKYEHKVCVCTYLHFPCSLTLSTEKALEPLGSSIARCIPSTLNLTVIPFPRAWLLAEITDPRERARKVPDKPGTSYCVRKQEALKE